MSNQLIKVATAIYQKHITKQGKPLKKSSINSMLKYITTIANHTDFEAQSTTFLKQTEGIIQFVDDNYKDPRNAYSAIVTLLKGRRGFKNITPIYRAKMMKGIKEHESKQEENKVPEVLEGRLDELEWTVLGKRVTTSLKKKLNKILKTGGSHKAIMNLYELYIFSLLIFKAGFLERLSYRTFKIITSLSQKNEDINQIKGNTMWWNDYKNVGAYGKMVKKLPVSITKEIKKYIAFKNNKEYLFYNEKFVTEDLHKAYTSKEFTKLPTRMMKVAGVSGRFIMNDLRRLFVRYNMTRPSYEPLDDKQRNKLHITKEFHNLKMARRTYRMAA